MKKEKKFRKVMKQRKNAIIKGKNYRNPLLAVILKKIQKKNKVKKGELLAVLSVRIDIRFYDDTREYARSVRVCLDNNVIDFYEDHSCKKETDIFNIPKDNWYNLIAETDQSLRAAGYDVRRDCPSELLHKYLDTHALMFVYA